MRKLTFNYVRQCVPSMTDIAFLLPLVLLFTRLGGAQFLLGDADTGWHIRTGEWILRNGRIPNHDIFSFTKAGEPWFAWEWLWDVIFAWIHLHGGLSGVVIASLLVICCTYALVYRLVRRRCPNPLIAMAVLFLAVASSTIHWLARPHMFTLLFVAVFLSLLERARQGQVRVLWVLPALTVLWVNLHGGFILAVVLTLAYAAGEVISLLADSAPEARRAAIVRGKPYLLTAAGCALASLINPYFFNLHVHIFRYLNDPFLFKTVAEFHSLNFQHPAARYFEPLLALGILAAGWCVYKRRFTELVLLGISIHPALTSVRNIPVFAILAAPSIAWMLYDLLAAASRIAASTWLKRVAREVEELGAETALMESLGRIPLASAACFAAVALAVFHAPAQASALRAEYNPKLYPERALPVLRDPALAQAIFTSDEWGDYLIYRLYPATKVFIDGRSDFYGAQFDQKFLDVMNGKFNWRETLERYGIRAVLLPVDASLASTLKESQEWRPVYDDGVAIVFRKTDTRTACAGRPETPRSSAADGGGTSVIARSPNIPIPVIERSRSYARR